VGRGHPLATPHPLGAFGASILARAVLDLGLPSRRLGFRISALCVPVPFNLRREHCTWFYVAAQMTHSVDDIAVMLLIHIIRVELRPTLTIQYLSHYVVERTTVAFYVCTAVVPRAIMISQCKIKLPVRMYHNYLYKILHVKCNQSIKPNSSLLNTDRRSVLETV